MARVGFKKRPCRSQSRRFLPLDHAADNNLKLLAKTTKQRKSRKVFFPRRRDVPSGGASEAVEIK